MSDHLPSLLKCKADNADTGPRKKRFHFENMWFTDSCKDIVQQASSSPTHNDAVESLVSKLEACATALSKWNLETFGYVGREIRKLEHRLKQDRDAISRHKTVSEIREWRNKEQVLWWQRARSDYLHARSLFTVRSAYHMIISQRASSGGSPSTHDAKLWQTLWNASQSLSEDLFGDFLAIMLKCWNARNRFIFGTPESKLTILGKRALALVRSYRLHHKVNALTHGTVDPSAWTPPSLGTKHQYEHADISVEEARACLYGLQCAHNHRVYNIIIEGDCLHLMELLKAKSTPDNFLGFLIKDIISFLARFNLYAWSFVKRRGNKVAYDLAH
ncbi:hypothetical protein Cgig2_004275 [Carnegiea gigantea]|uniref:RNase H type-1 domain-containing protein n=1 Tax=Carnegiea gigantea TaxID=171969 RepID=A0A9Q1QK35_9CARY|nr:hypothetical protein Cgig2_004275 [Carnegiea gigantea]